MEVVVLQWGHTAANSARKPIQNWLTFSPLQEGTHWAPLIYSWVFTSGSASPITLSSVKCLCMEKKIKPVSFHSALGVEAPFQIHPIISTYQWKCICCSQRHCALSLNSSIPALPEAHPRATPAPLPGKPGTCFSQRQRGICWCQRWPLADASPPTSFSCDLRALGCQFLIAQTWELSGALGRERLNTLKRAQNNSFVITTNKVSKYLMKTMAFITFPFLSSHINLENRGINLLLLKKPQILSNHKIIESFRLYKTVRTEPNPALNQVPKWHIVQCCQFKWKCMCHNALYSHTTTKI